MNMDHCKQRKLKMTIKMILAPLLGALIGYITNDIAIKMLFRPYKAKYIGRFHIPFTPGVIPRRQERIAKSIGTVISDELLSAETIKKAALSEKALATVRSTVDQWLDGVVSEERTLRNILTDKVRVENLPEKEEKVKTHLKELIFAKVLEAGLGHKLAKLAVSEVNIPLLANVIRTMEEPVAKMIDNMINTKGEDFIAGEIDKLDRKLLDDSVRSLVSDYADKKDEVTDAAVNIYTRFINELLPELIKKIGIDRIVTDKLMEYDPSGLEKLIFRVAKSELKAIVYFGAFLGFMMGFINLLY